MGDFEGKLMGWLSALWPAIQAVVDAVATMFRRLVLGMFGGVAKEDAAADKARQQVPGAPEARPDAELEEWQVVDRRKWSTNLVRQALTLTAAGRGLRSVHRDNLPKDVLDWIGALPEDEIKELLSMAPADLRAEFDLYSIGGQVLDMLADDRREAEAAPEPRGEGGPDGSPPPDADPEAPTGPGRRP